MRDYIAAVAAIGLERSSDRSGEDRRAEPAAEAAPAEPSPPPAD